MIMKRIGLILLALPLIAVAAHAQRAAETHYFAIGLGIPMNSYPDDTRRLVADLDATEGVTRLPLDFDVAAYWPIVDGRTVLGPAVHGSADNLTRGDETIALNVIGLGASARRWITGTTGDGLFGRLDAGVAFAGISHDIGSERYSKSGNFGFGGMIGAGYSFAVSSGTSLEVAANAAWRSLPGYTTGRQGSGDIFESGDYTTVAVDVAVLW
jgi:hypothetical protein